MKLPNVDAPLKNNADVKKMERAIADFDEKIKELVSHIGNQGKNVPKMMHKGGKMWP